MPDSNSFTRSQPWVAVSVIDPGRVPAYYYLIRKFAVFSLHSKAVV